MFGVRPYSSTDTKTKMSEESSLIQNDNMLLISYCGRFLPLLHESKFSCKHLL